MALLRTLRIRNLIIIEDLSAEFGPGLNLLTGETGAGKSILVDALGLVAGARADRSLVRAGSEGATVEYEVLAGDNCDRPVRIECDPPSGSVFPVGVTPVECVAYDACGNSSVCSFEVIVGSSVLRIIRAVIIEW